VVGCRVDPVLHASPNRIHGGFHALRPRLDGRRYRPQTMGKRHVPPRGMVHTNRHDWRGGGVNYMYVVHSAIFRSAKGVGVGAPRQALVQAVVRVRVRVWLLELTCTGVGADNELVWLGMRGMWVRQSNTLNNSTEAFSVQQAEAFRSREEPMPITRSRSQVTPRGFLASVRARYCCLRSMW